MPECMEVECTTSVCMIDEEIFYKLQGEGDDEYYHEYYWETDTTFDWTASNYSEFWGKSMLEGQLILGAEKPSATMGVSICCQNLLFLILLSFFIQAVHQELPRRLASNLPSSFNSFLRWPNLISPVPNQGWCPSSWAVAATSVASDRTSLAVGRPLHLDPRTMLGLG